jgi:hypothetical protein
MGHTRLGSIRTGQKWQAVVAVVAWPDNPTRPGDEKLPDVEQVAKKALDAAQAGMRKVSRRVDPQRPLNLPPKSANFYFGSFNTSYAGLPRCVLYTGRHTGRI